MKTAPLSILLLTTSLLGGCASMNGPSREEIAALPVISYGEQTPPDGRFVLHFPAGKPVSLPVHVDGHLFTRGDEQTLKVALARDVYSYKEWVSFDGNTWKPANEALDMQLKLLLPSWKHPRSGELSLHIDPAQ